MPKQGLASIGIKTTIKEFELNYVTGIGDIGGEPSSLDSTCLKDTIAKSVPGVKKNEGHNIDILFDNSDAESDYRKIKAMEGEVVPVVHAFPDGTQFSTTAYVSIKINAVKVDELIGATIKCDLQSDWTETNPAT